ncbi:MAG: sialate O-acetylesterase [Clostridia bacterium]|nr:sialate O-acetylesterase [Clostridia bacterium]
MMHSFLLIGQSNASGRGKANEVEPISNDKLFVYRNGRWRNMYTPVCPDAVSAGVCLIESFADLYQKENNVDVGIIPAAIGGTNLDQWVEGGVVFENAVSMATLAARTSNIAGIIWHQGESDCYEDKYPFYEEKLRAIITAFRNRLELNDVPFLLGGLGDYLEFCPRSDVFKNYVHINEQLQNIANTTEMIGFVSAKGLTSNEDYLHFNAPSLREFGIRYYNEFRKLAKKNKTFTERTTTDSQIKTDLENL